MTFWESIVTGLATGLGVGLANWISTNKINKALDKMDTNIKTIAGANPNIKFEGVTKENIQEKIWGK
jgi:hypothetical protein